MQAGGHGGWTELVVLGGERQRGLEDGHRLVGGIDATSSVMKLMPGADSARGQLLHLLGPSSASGRASASRPCPNGPSPAGLAGSSGPAT